MEARTVLVVALALLAPLAASSGEAGARWLVVTYDGPIPPAERAFLQTLGPIADHVPPFGYLARLAPADEAALRARAAVLSIAPLAPDARLSPEMMAGGAEARLLLHADAAPAQLAARLLRDGATWARVAAGPEPMVDVSLGPLHARDLLRHPEVRWIEPLRERAELDNARASAIVQSAANDLWPLHAAGIDGSTQIVAYCDTGLDTDAPFAAVAGRATHPLFADALAPLAHQVASPHHRKVALYYSPVDLGGLRGDMDDADGHGTHVAGTLAGDGGVHGARDGHDGVAYAARLAVCDAARGTSFQVLADQTAYWRPAYEVGARVHSNSWGTTPTSHYTLAARQHDAYTWAHRDFLLVRSMGNGGPDGAMRPEAASKNVLAAGATANDAAAAGVEPFSARGPTADGRVKPDLVAPGSCITSADLGGAYTCRSGTSYSTPVVAGGAALVRDHFAKLDPPHEASAALVRALLVGSARPLAAPAPDAAEGWGRPALAPALATLRLAQDEGAALETGDVWTATLDLQTTGALRVVLAWTDHPAAPGASPALVNDLDLEVVTPGGALLRGNADLAAPDRANVIERVILEDAPPGAYTVRVRAWNVPMGPQPFALVVLKE